MRLDDPELVRRECTDESRLATRVRAWESATGPDPRQLAFEAVAEAGPRRVLEVGPGRGKLAERIARELGAEVVGVDRSARMAELTQARGVPSLIGDVQALPFPAGEFDCVVAAWTLYHVPDLDRALSEVRRVLQPGGRLVAVTSSEWNLPELWGTFDGRAQREHGFSAENGAWPLLRHFTLVERRDVRGTVTFPDWEAARRYIASSVTRAHLADDLPRFEGPLRASRHAAVFVCEP